MVNLRCASLAAAFLLITGSAASAQQPVARNRPGVRDRVEDMRDRREDHRDRAEDRRDRREDRADRAEDRIDVAGTNRGGGAMALARVVGAAGTHRGGPEERR